MSLDSQQYAQLARDSYEPHRMKDEIVRDGVKYIVLEHVDNQHNGYQGTIYQRMDTHEIVVAHRGTEFGKGLKAALQDGGLADGGMVLARTNAQANDAIELTRRAVEHAKKSAPDYGGRVPEVTVTGHSLGGCLAQIVAHKFDLKGETFNAYGAVSLDQRIPEGGNNLINHVMAADPVSAAGKHFGQVRVYATPEEIVELQRAGYDNSRNPLQPRSLPMAASSSLDSHYMDNFLNVDSDNRPDRSVLSDPRSRELAAQFDPAIDRYRSDLALARGAVTFVARDPFGRMQDGLDSLRGPLPIGELVRREERAVSAMSWEEVRGMANPDRPLPTRESPYVPELTRPGGTLSLPGYLPHFDGHNRPPLRQSEETPRYQDTQQSSIPPHHPDHALYAELKQRLPQETSEDRLAQITVAAKMGGVKPGQVDRIHIDDSLHLFVSGNRPGDRAGVDLAAQLPTLQETMQRSQAFDQQQAQQLGQFQAQQQHINAEVRSGPGMTAA